MGVSLIFSEETLPAVERLLDYMGLVCNRTGPETIVVKKRDWRPDAADTDVRRDELSVAQHAHVQDH